MMKQLFLHGIGGPISGLIVDLFAGGGGASSGIEQATGRPPDIAINHDPAAVKMHEANHPGTHHRCESIFNVDPVQATAGQPVALLWASPSCTHFSRARGGTPVSKQLRGLGWMVLKWAGKVRPQVIICENVAEWQTWGPVRKGQPWARRKGASWKLFLASLERLGYQVCYKVLDAADYGAPTHRRRLFLVARCDGMPPVVEPAPTHGPGRVAYRTAAECIDWSDLGRSIFTRKKPLAPATCRRIAAGIMRYVINGKPFIVTCNHGKEGFRGQSVDDPMKTITASRDAHGLVTAFLAKHFTGVIGQPMDQPLGTVTAVDHHSLIACHLTKFRQNAIGSDCAEPMPTITSGAGAKRPAGAAHALGLVAASLVTLRNNCVGQSPSDPIGTITTGGHFALCASFLTTYYSGGGTANPVNEPVPTIVAKARHGLVTVDIDGTTYALADIRLRMLKPAELARAQGFPAGYILTGTQAEQIGRIGNSVCPPIAAALVRANLPAAREKTA